MKKIGDGYYIYKNYDIYLAVHPKLYGKYEIYKGCDFIKRTSTIEETKKYINNLIKPKL